MNLIEQIRTFSRQPLTHQLLVSWLKDYKRPNDKINELISKDALIPIKKGIYVAGPSINASLPELILIANHLLGPSYISSDTALSYHGLIPERVYEITSVTTKSSRVYEASIGKFTFVHLPLPYYSFGLNSVLVGENQQVLMASKEKAVCDKIITTKGVILRSVNQANDYLVKNLRMDVTILKSFDTITMQDWLDDSPKAESISMIIKLIREL